MANTKSIIDIEINDQPLQQAFERFKKYQANLNKMPGQWGKVGEAASKAATNFDEAVSALNNASEAMNNLVEMQQKATKEQDKLNKQVGTTERAFKSIGKSVGGIAKDVAATTGSLIKWAALGTVLGAIGGGGGLFGIASLAGSVSNNRREAQGLGVSSGELRSAQLNFQRYIDASSTLSSVAAAQVDPSKRWAFSSTGVNPNQSAAQALPELMRRAAEEYRAGPEETAATRLQARGFTELGVSVSDARRLASLKREELDLAIKKYGADKKNLEVSDAVQRQWQDLDTQLDRSKNLIQQAFITGLVPLIPNIEDFSKSVADAIKIFLSNPELKVWLKDFGEGIKYAAEWLSQFDFGKKHFAEQHAGQEEALKKGDYFTPKAKQWAKDQWSSAINFFQGKGWTTEQAAGIVGNLHQESGFNPGAKNPKSGMRGIAQWDTSRRKDFETWAGFPITDPRADVNKQLEFINYELTQGKERKAGAALSKAATVSQATSIFENKYERAGGADLEKRLSFANAAYANHISSLNRNNVRVQIQNNTGGSATAVAGAMATPDLGYSALAGT